MSDVKSKIEYKIPQAKELKMGMHDAHALSEFLSELMEDYDLTVPDRQKIDQWKQVLEPKPIA